jgi:hypothetical protein
MIDSGPAPDLAFRELIRSLRNAYEKSTGKKASARTIRKENCDDEAKDPKNEPAEFQKFVLACALGFGIKTISTFHNKVRDTLSDVNKLYPKTKVTANFP